MVEMLSIAIVWGGVTVSHSRHGGYHSCSDYLEHRDVHRPLIVLNSDRCVSCSSILTPDSCRVVTRKVIHLNRSDMNHEIWGLRNASYFQKSGLRVGIMVIIS